MIVFVEAATTGSGLTFLKYLYNNGYDVGLVTTNPEKYTQSSGGDILDELRKKKKVFTVDNFDDQASISSLIRAIRKTGQGEYGVICSADKYLIHASKIAFALEAPYIEPDIAIILRDKRESRKIYNQLDIGDVRWSDASSLETVLSFYNDLNCQPIVLKNVAGTGSLDVYILDDEKSIVEAWNNSQRCQRWLEAPLMVEEYIEGVLFSAEVIVSQSKPQILGFTDRQLSAYPTVAEIGYTFPAHIPDNYAVTIREVIKKITNGFGIQQGFLHIEMIISSDGVRVVEVNPRLPGALVTYMLRDCLEGHFYDAVANSALGADPGSLKPNGWYSSGCIVYAPVKGRATTDSNIEKAMSVPWIMDIIGGARKGDIFDTAQNFRGSIAHVRSLAPSSSLSTISARTASERLIPKMEPIYD